MYTLLVFLGVLVVLVIAHEFGHFIVARRSGMRVYEFGFGFPPKIANLAKINGKWRLGGPRMDVENAEGTVYTLNLLPLGGFVRIKGENNADPSALDSDSFSSKKTSRKIGVLLAGVGMNVVVAALLLSGTYMVGVPEAVSPEAALQNANHYVQVLEVVSGGAGEMAGLLPGDQVIGVGEIVSPNTEQFRDYVQAHQTEQIVFAVKRGDQNVSVSVTPVIDAVEGRALVGVAIADVVIKKFGFFAAVFEGVKTTGFYGKEIIFGLGKLVASIFGGPSVDGGVSGPVGVAVMTGQAARMGLVYLAQFAAILSLNLAVLNVLPIPALDGGRLLFVIINAIKRKPVSPKLEQIVHSVTFMLLILLVVVITAKDIGGLLPPLGTWFHK